MKEAILGALNFKAKAEAKARALNEARQAWRRITRLLYETIRRERIRTQSGGYRVTFTKKQWEHIVKLIAEATKLDEESVKLGNED